MGSVNVSQIVDYEGYNSEYAYATISWDEGSEVTVTITSSNVATWRIRGQGSDTTEYCLGVGGATSGTFNATDGKTYVFQIYSQTYSTYSDGELFTVNFDSDDTGDDSTPSSHTLYIKQGEGTSVTVNRVWSDNGNTGKLSNGSKIWYESDLFYVTAKALTGYKLDNYTFNGLTLGYKLSNFKYSHTGEDTGYVYIKLSKEADEFTLTRKSAR